MTTKQQRAGALACANALRTERKRLRLNVAAGRASLYALLLDYNHDSILGVELQKLVRWMPGAGTDTARNILRGLPAAAYARELTPNQFYTFTQRVRAHELHRATTR